MESNYSRKVATLGAIVVGTVCCTVPSALRAGDEQEYPSPAPSADDRHGDTFDGVPIVLETEKTGDVVTTAVEGYWTPEKKWVRHGWTITYYDSGMKRTKTLWRQGYPDGPRWTWYAHGQIWSVGAYEDGIEHGTWRRWHQNGEQYSEWTIRHGAWHGVMTEWHPNGKKKMEVEFVEGLRQGPMFLYDEQGVLMTRTDYVDSVEQP